MYGFKNPEDIALFAPVGGKVKVTATGSAHNMDGDLKKNDPETIALLKHLEEKIQAHKDELIDYELNENPGAKTLIISFGITGRTVREVLRRSNKMNKRVSSLIIRSLFPIPEELIKSVSTKYDRIIIPRKKI